MSNGRLDRSWVSPLTGLGFIVVAATGVLMFFHVRIGAIHVLHEIGGLLFLVVGVLHVILNGRAFLAYFRRRIAQVLVAAALLICVLVAVGAGSHVSENGRPGTRGRGYDRPAAQDLAGD